MIRTAVIAGALVVSGCAFFEPVWEFSTSPRGDAGDDAGGGDAGGVDAGRPDSGPVVRTDAGPVVCTACTLADPAECSDGFGCYVRDLGAATECTVCVERSGVEAALGESCTIGPDCARGLDCIAGLCRNFCNESVACGGDEGCFFFSDPPLTGWCLGADCDPVARGTCESGLACTILTNFSGDGVASYCAPPGSAPEGDPCAADGCAEGSACLGGLRCAAVCRTDEDCGHPQYTSCAGIGMLGPDVVGICLQPCAGDGDCTGGGLCQPEIGLCV